MSIYPESAWGGSVMTNGQAVVRFSARDPEAFAQAIAPGAVPRASVQALGPAFESDTTLAILPRLSLFSLRIDDTRIRDFDAFEQIAINIPLAEPFRFRSGATTRVCSTGMAFVRRPGDAFDLTTPHRSDCLVAHFSPQLTASVEEELGGPLRLDDLISLQTPEGESFFRYLCFLWRELQRGAGFLRSPLATREIENSLATLFYAAAEAQRQQTPAPSSAVSPAYLRRAEAYVRANLTESLSVLDVAAAACVSPRTLSQAFRKHRGISTQAFVKQRRLEATQRALLAAEPGGATVTDTALRFGFVHMGHFSVDYHRAFGETPSETLRRKRLFGGSIY